MDKDKLKLVGTTTSIKVDDVSKYSSTTQQHNYTAIGMCGKCHKPFVYAGDVPQGGWTIGLEPYCTCGVERCKHCNQIIKK